MARVPILKCSRTLLPTLLLLLLVGLQSSPACSVAVTSGHILPEVSVNACHLTVDPTHQARTCCDSVACHRSSIPLRHLGSPEFANQIKDVLPLIQESRQSAPQPRITPVADQHRFRPATSTRIAAVSTVPRQAQTFLRTTVLLH